MNYCMLYNINCVSFCFYFTNANGGKGWCSKSAPTPLISVDSHGHKRSTHCNFTRQRSCQNPVKCRVWVFGTTQAVTNKK